MRQPRLDVPGRAITLPVMAMSPAARKALLALHNEGERPTGHLLSLLSAQGHILLSVSPEALIEATSVPQAKRPPDPLPLEFDKAWGHYLRRIVLHGSGGWDAIPLPASVEASLVEGGEIEVNDEGHVRATALGRQKVLG